MTGQHFLVITESSAYDLEASVQAVGKDLLVAVWGGVKPHIGAVAVAQPRPSLKDPAVNSASASVVCLLGHKEDQLARAMAETLAAVLNTVVTVTAGIHWNGITARGIETVVRNSQILTDRILEEIFSRRGFLNSSGSTPG